jgi:hypothetical protein
MVVFPFLLILKTSVPLICLTLMWLSLFMALTVSFPFVLTTRTSFPVWYSFIDKLSLFSTAFIIVFPFSSTLKNSCVPEFIIKG